MRMFAAAISGETTSRTAVPVEILRRLASGRPQRGAIQPAMPVRPPPVAQVIPAPSDDGGDLDQRVRQSGEW